MQQTLAHKAGNQRQPRISPVVVGVPIPPSEPQRRLVRVLHVSPHGLAVLSAAMGLVSVA